jgi:hypothetical protein
MQMMSAKGYKNSFGLLLDRVRATSIESEKHSKRVPVVISIIKFQRLFLALVKSAAAAYLYGRSGG